MSISCSLEDFKLFPLSPMSSQEGEDTNSDEDELSEVSSISSSPSSPMTTPMTTPNEQQKPNTQTSTNTINSSIVSSSSSSSLSSSTTSSSTSSSPSSIISLIDRPRRMTKRDQLDRLDFLECAKKTRKLTSDEKKEFQKLRRRKQNRDAAATSRDRKRDYTSSLEGTIKMLQEKQVEMQRTIDALINERNNLMKQIKQIDEAKQDDSQQCNSNDQMKEDHAKRGKKRMLDSGVSEINVVNSSTLVSLNSSELNSSAELAGDGRENSITKDSNDTVKMNQHNHQTHTINHSEANLPEPSVCHSSSNMIDNDNDDGRSSKRIRVNSTLDGFEVFHSSTMCISEEVSVDKVADSPNSAVAALSFAPLDDLLAQFTSDESQFISSIPSGPTSLSIMSAFESMDNQQNIFPLTCLQRETSLVDMVEDNKLLNVCAFNNLVEGEVATDS